MAKLLTLMLMVAAVATAAPGRAQTLTLKVKDASLHSVFKEIKKQTGYDFLYTDEQLTATRKVTLTAVSQPLTSVLDQCFLNQPVSYKIIEKTIVVTALKAVALTSGASGAKALALDNASDPRTSSDEAEAVIDITGKVTDQDGAPLAGASIRVRGTNIGTKTDANGSFTLKGIEPNAILEISFSGYEAFVLPVNGKNGIVAQLKPDAGNMQEVVINKGPYSEKQKYSISNVGRISSAEIEKQNVNNPMLALQGRVPGLVITQQNGVPGGGVIVRIQGQNSLNGGNDPLYVIDGIPYISQLLKTGVSNDILGNSGGRSVQGNVPAGNPMSHISPSDIESIEVLKDADATAIFGSRAANGAILITTKTGKQGQRKFTADYKIGWGRVVRKMEMLNRRQYLDMRYEAFRNDGIVWQASSVSANDLKVYDTTRETDWQQTLIGGTALCQAANLSLTGGNQTSQYLLSATYSKETTVFPGNFYNRKGGIHFNLNTGSPSQRVHIKFTGTMLLDYNDLPVNDVTQASVVLEPIAPRLYKENGELNWEQDQNGTTTFLNPIGDRLTNRYKNNTFNSLLSLYAKLKIADGLEMSNNVGLNNMFTREFGSIPLESTRPEDRPFTSRFAQFGNRTVSSWILEPQLKYEKHFGLNDLSILSGVTLNTLEQNSNSVFGSGFNNDLSMKDLASAGSVFKGPSVQTLYRYSAGYFRVNLISNRKYIISCNGRRDASSRFGARSSIHNFGSLGAAWIFSAEDFFKSTSALKFGKLRVNYGTTGNDQIGDYSYMNLFNPANWTVPYQGVISFEPNGHDNPYLEWEETRKISAGLDLTFFEESLQASFTYQRNRSSNQLLSYILPFSTGFSSALLNFPATVQNSTWESLISTKILNNVNFLWSAALNISVPSNKLVNFPDLANTTYATSLRVGQPVGVKYVYSFAGVDPSNGRYSIYDSLHNPVQTGSSLKDRISKVITAPKYYGGFQNSINYKSLNIDLFFQFVKQRGLNYNYNNSFASPGQFFRGVSNQPVSVLDRWTKPGQISQIQRFSTALSSTLATSSDGVYGDASYVRLKNISLSYNFSGQGLSRKGIEKIRVYVQAQNLITFTNYVGLDPETQSISSLPPLRVSTIGCQIIF